MTRLLLTLAVLLAFTQFSFSQEKVDFARDVLPAIDDADKAFTTVERAAFAISGVAPQGRKNIPAVPLINEKIQEARELAKAALAKLPQNEYPDELLEKARLAARTYLQDVAELLERFDQFIHGGDEWDKVTRDAEREKIKKCRLAWREAREQL